MLASKSIVDMFKSYFCLGRRRDPKKAKGKQSAGFYRPSRQIIRNPFRTSVSISRNGKEKSTRRPEASVPSDVDNRGRGGFIPADESIGQNEHLHERDKHVPCYRPFDTAGSLIQFNESPSQGVSAAEREELTSQLSRALVDQDPEYLSWNQREDISHTDFIYDVIICTHSETDEGDDQIRRRLTLDFITDENVMADAIQKRLNVELKPYDGKEIRLRGGQSEVKPVGKAEALWRLYDGSRYYRTQFFVIQTRDFDILLGRPSIREHQLFRIDPAIATRLLASYSEE